MPGGLEYRGKVHNCAAAKSREVWHRRARASHSTADSVVDEDDDAGAPDRGRRDGVGCAAAAGRMAH